MASIIDRVDFFAEFPQSVRRALAPKFRLRCFEAGEQIIEDQASDSDVFFVLSGSVSIGQFTEDGHELIYEIYRKEGMFGEFAAIDSRPRSANVRAFEAAELACINASDFRSIVHTYPDIALKLQQHLIRIIRRLTLRLKRRIGASAYGRVYSYIAEEAEILRQTKRQGMPILIPKQAILASMLDISRETVARALSQLMKEGIVRKEEGGVCLLDEARLIQLLENQGS